MIRHLFSYGNIDTYRGRGRGIWGEEENVVDIHLYSYNICNDVYRGIYLALHVIVQGNKDLEFRYKTKIMRSIYTNHLTDNNLILSEAPIKHQGGGSNLLLRLLPFPDRGEPVLCPHVFIFQLVTRRKRWFFVR